MEWYYSYLFNYLFAIELSHSNEKFLVKSVKIRNSTMQLKDEKDIFWKKNPWSWRIQQSKFCKKFIKLNLLIFQKL